MAIPLGWGMGKSPKIYYNCYYYIILLNINSTIALTNMFKFNELHQFNLTIV